MYTSNNPMFEDGMKDFEAIEVDENKNVDVEENKNVDVEEKEEVKKEDVKEEETPAAPVEEPVEEPVEDAVKEDKPADLITAQSQTEYSCPCGAIVKPGTELHICSNCSTAQCPNCFDYDSPLCEECISKANLDKEDETSAEPTEESKANEQEEVKEQLTPGSDDILYISKSIMADSWGLFRTIEGSIHATRLFTFVSEEAATHAGLKIADAIGGEFRGKEDPRKEEDSQRMGPVEGKVDEKKLENLSDSELDNLRQHLKDISDMKLDDIQVLELLHRVEEELTSRDVGEKKKAESKADEQVEEKEEEEVLSTDAMRKVLVDFVGETYDGDIEELYAKYIGKKVPESKEDKEEK